MDTRQAQPSVHISPPIAPAKLHVSRHHPPISPASRHNDALVLEHSMYAAEENTRSSVKDASTHAETARTKMTKSKSVHASSDQKASNTSMSAVSISQMPSSYSNALHNGSGRVFSDEQLEGIVKSRSFAPSGKRPPESPNIMSDSKRENSASGSRLLEGSERTVLPRKGSSHAKKPSLESYAKLYEQFSQNPSPNNSLVMSTALQKRASNSQQVSPLVDQNKQRTIRFSEEAMYDSNFNSSDNLGRASQSQHTTAPPSRDVSSRFSRRSTAKSIGFDLLDDESIGNLEGLESVTMSRQDTQKSYASYLLKNPSLSLEQEVKVRKSSVVPGLKFGDVEVVHVPQEKPVVPQECNKCVLLKHQLQDLEKECLAYESALRAQMIMCGGGPGGNSSKSSSSSSSSFAMSSSAFKSSVSRPSVDPKTDLAASSSSGNDSLKLLRQEVENFRITADFLFHKLKDAEEAHAKNTKQAEMKKP